MKKVIAVMSFIVFCLVGLNVSAAEKDRPGSKDHPLLTRMPDFHIDDYKEKDFDRYQFFVQSEGKVIRTPIEGHYYYISYKLDQGATSQGDLKVVRNIENALTAIGGTVIFQGERPWSTTVKLEKDGKETWVEVRSFPTLYRLTIIEREAMKQEVVADAEAMGKDITSAGHAIVEGIYFDRSKADIKPESDAAIAEIARLLKDNSTLKVYIVGHTDSTGSFDLNMKLSIDRANAVMNVLVSKHGIDAARLKAYGVCSLCPVASNRTEEGKAKNRRVELVEQ